MSNYERFKSAKKASFEEIEQRKKEVYAATSQNEYEGIRKKNLKDDGVYVIRMYPEHPVDEDSKEIPLPVESKSICFVPAMVNKKDANGKWVKDQQDNPIKVEGVRPVFNAVVHGKAKLDLVDTYATLVKKAADSIYGVNKSEKKTEYLAPLVGNKFSGGQYNGLNYIVSNVFYGDLITKNSSGEEEKEFFEFEVKAAAFKVIKSAAAIESAGATVGTINSGIFTDIEEGLPFKLVINGAEAREKNDTKLYYTASIYKNEEKVNHGGKILKTIKQYPLSEEELDWFVENATPLINYRTMFKRSDLETQLRGLKMFDEKFGYGILETEEFKEAYEYLDKLFPKEDGDGDESEENASEYSQPQNSSSNEDEFDLMEMSELKEYNKANKLGLIILPRYSEEEVRHLIREAISEGIDAKEVEEDLPEEYNDADEVDSVADESNKSEPEEENKDTELSQSKTGGWKNRIQNLGKNI